MPTVNRKVLRLLRTAKLCGRALRLPASENAKSMRFNFGVAAPLKRARHLPGVMQMANATKQGSAAPCWIKAHTFGLFRKSCGTSRLRQHKNGRFRGSRGLSPPATARKRPSSGDPGRHLVRKRRGSGFFADHGGCLVCSSTKTAVFRRPREVPRSQAARERPLFRHPTPLDHRRPQCLSMRSMSSCLEWTSVFS